MKTHVRQTSMLAYLTIEDELGERQQQVLQAVHLLGTACNLDISRTTNLPINAVTPRTNELVEKGLVVEAFRDVCPQTGRKAIYWRAA